ncbi:post-transcriptional regulator [Mesobacillus zeae]|uniref:Post-transcriptional regulator n=1 Tax=Mesobacillus zeae TaxID=1917180 RepID=A0A398B1C1_9BACI|nr:post-transcriptional regulator [Mesobacillus zeae]RID83729.1 post-transcriptional regulator [Mesobacillus zeae]
MNSGNRHVRYWREVQPAIKSKIEEIGMLGFEKVTAAELWNYLDKKKWKNLNEDLHLYEVVADVLSVKPGELINFMTVEAFRSASTSLDGQQDSKPVEQMD